MRLLVLGDIHGNTEFARDYVVPTAERIGADACVQVGDFGFYEHEPDGVEYVDDIGYLAKRSQVPWYVLHGNHDNADLVLQYYGNDRTRSGFVRVRDGDLLYIPQGHTWNWRGVRFRAFGGAYSVDKLDLVDEEQRLNRRAKIAERERRAVGRARGYVENYTGTRWFPHEEMTDEEFEMLMVADSDPVDVILSHDKPRSSNPGIKLAPIPECGPNQDRLQRALRVHQPSIWVHGHLHVQYTDTVMCGDEGRTTTVHGLAADPAGMRRSGRAQGYDRRDSWCVLDLDNGKAVYRSSFDLVPD